MKSCILICCCKVKIWTSPLTQPWCPSPSRPAGAHVQLPDQPGAVPDQQQRPVQRAALPVRLHLPAAARRALPYVALRRPVHAGQQPHGHREHLWAGRAPAVQRRGVGQEHPLLPRPAAHGPGELPAAAPDWKYSNRALRLIIIIMIMINFIYSVLFIRRSQRAKIRSFVKSKKVKKK